MIKALIMSLVCALVVTPVAPKAQNAAKAPKPELWLKQLNGAWDAQSEMVMAPGAPPIKAKSTERVRSVGGWMMAEHTIAMGGTPMTGIMTVGYDSAKKKFVGTWIDSATNYMWHYEGTLDATGKKLTLEAEGPNPSAGGKMARFRDAIEVTGPGRKLFTSSILGDDGKWVTFQTTRSQRKK